MPTGTYDTLLRDAAVALTAAGIDNARFEARLLLSRASGLSTEVLIAQGRDEAPATTVQAFRSLTARRVQREPMAYILGEREFWGLTFKVTPDVLVPRPDSETIIEAALVRLGDRTQAWRILDLGLGSGCLLLTLLREYVNARGVGLELSPAALQVAEDNALALGVADRADLRLGDWSRPGWDQSFGGPFDLVVSNPPYIPSNQIDELMPEVARFEPRQALDGGSDGFAAYRLIAKAGRNLITRGGLLLVEVGVDQAPEISRILAGAGLSPQDPVKDLAGIDRVVPGKH
jgi:release factor glutamine methyltransferase